MRDNEDNEYYLGGYWPPESPEIYVKQVPLKEKYKYLYIDPRFRLQLYEAVYHGSIVISSHRGSNSLKFLNTISEQSLTELLYGVQSLYNLNLEAIEKHGAYISEFYRVFSPLHTLTATLEMTEFDYLTDDRLVQRTRFGSAAEVFVNVSDSDIVVGDLSIASMYAVIRYTDEEVLQIYPAMK